LVVNSPVELSRGILERCRGMGFAAAGIAPARASRWKEEVLAWLAAGKHGEMGYLAKDLELKLDPARVLEGTRAFIMVADQYAEKGSLRDGLATSGFDPHEVPATPSAGAEGDRQSRHPRLEDSAPPPNARRGIGRVARYAQGRNYHWVMKNRLHRLSDQLREEHPGAKFRTFVDTVPVLERELAELAGIGWQAKNSMIINARLGSWLLLGGVATTLELEPPPEQTRRADHCGTCTRCIEACPTKAITPYSVDGSRCISYLTIEHRSAIDPALHAAMGDWVYGCDVCQEVCPHNSAREGAEAPARNPVYESKHPTLALLDVLGWTRESRREAFTSTAMKRANLEMMKRNAVIAAGNRLRRERDPALLARLEELARDEGEPEMVRRTAGEVIAGLGRG
jgi:epoxyqueuosine reductase